MAVKTFQKEDENTLDSDPQQEQQEQPDSQINYNDAIEYWSSVPASINGVLGGYGEQTSVPKSDIIGSQTFLRKLQTRMQPPTADQPKITIDMGAGIGRITRDLLWKISDSVDLLEPVKPFVNQIPIELKLVKEKGKLGDIYPIGMQDWIPSKKYWLIWCQWCVGQLPDDELIKFWIKCKNSLVENGTMIVKENIAPINDIFDETDSSVTRTDSKFRQLFIDSGFKLIASDLQKGLPKELYPVRMYCLKVAPA
ncbi:uncharacterized protein KGF55_004957 [Candida pseudojiufengensis]|uniref:uncharacterized protein n=1 Tax=Candida pseudojiufengensis TaxID=497109 RepID=UPI0022259CB5|nr:uncharacterized protein KGF55_004957 [Candida pseudojiufengensis]KAI5959725.1 hypothetical protein KGF55_004957 [Candida pseudojiufengensis]